MVHVRAYTRTVNGHTVDVASHDRSGTPNAASYTELKAAGRAADFNYIETLPENRKSVITDRAESYAKAVAAIDSATLSETEKHLYKLFYVWEGGMKEHPTGTVAGITRETMRWAAKDVKGLSRMSWPRDIKTEQLPQVYTNVLDEGLRWAGGAAALSKIPDVDVAAFVGDTILREGGPSAARDIQFALNDTLGALEQPMIKPDFKIGIGTIEKIAEVTSSDAGRNKFCSSLEQHRNTRYPDGGDISRTAYFVSACR